MFGPDMCGSTKRTHVIFNYPPKDENLEDQSTDTGGSEEKGHTEPPAGIAIGKELVTEFVP